MKLFLDLHDYRLIMIINYRVIKFMIFPYLNYSPSWRTEADIDIIFSKLKVKVTESCHTIQPLYITVDAFGATENVPINYAKQVSSFRG